MLVPIIAGSDKTTVTAGTGQVDYWPIYGSIGNIHNNIRRAHGDGLILIGFLAIPKSKLRKILVIITHIICSQQGACWVGRLLSIPSAVIPCVVSHYIQFPRTRNDEARGCVMPWWSLPSHHLGTRTLHRRLPRTGASFLYRAGLVPKVGFLSMLSLLLLIFLQRCRAPSGKLDSNEDTYDRRSRAHTDFLCTRCEMGLLYDNYGIIGDIIVCTVSANVVLCSMLIFSPLQMNFRVPTYMNSLHRIYCIKLLKEYLKII